MHHDNSPMESIQLIL